MEIESFVKVGELLFSDSREVVRKKMKQTFEVGVKEFGNVKDYYDYFLTSEIFVGYDKKDNITAFECYKGPITFEGIEVFAKSYAELEMFFLGRDAELEIEGTGFTSVKLGIAVQAIFAATEDSSARIDSVFIFKRDYYK